MRTKEHLDGVNSSQYQLQWELAARLVENQSESPLQIDLQAIEEGSFPQFLPTGVILTFMDESLSETEDIIQLAQRYAARRLDRKLTDLKDTDSVKALSTISTINQLIEDGATPAEVNKALSREDVHTVLDYLWCDRFISSNPVRLQNIAIKSGHPFPESAHHNVLSQAYSALTQIERDSKGTFIPKLVKEVDRIPTQIGVSLTTFPQFDSFVRAAFLHPGQLLDHIDHSVDRYQLLTIFYANLAMRIPPQVCAKRLNISEYEALRLVETAADAFQFLYNSQLWQKGLVSTPIDLSSLKLGQKTAKPEVQADPKQIPNGPGTITVNGNGAYPVRRRPKKNETLHEVEPVHNQAIFLRNVIKHLPEGKERYVRLSPFRKEMMARALQGDSIELMDRLSERDQPLIKESQHYLTHEPLTDREYDLYRFAFDRLAVAYLLFDSNGVGMLDQFNQNLLADQNDSVQKTLSRVVTTGSEGYEKALMLFVQGESFAHCMEPMISAYLDIEPGELKALLSTLISCAEWIASGAEYTTSREGKAFILGRLKKYISRAIRLGDPLPARAFVNSFILQEKERQDPYYPPTAMIVPTPVKRDPPYKKGTSLKFLPRDEVDEASIALFANLPTNLREEFRVNSHKHNLLTLLLTQDHRLDDWLSSIDFPMADGIGAIRESFLNYLYEVTSHRSESDFPNRVFTWVLVRRELENGWLTRKLQTEYSLEGNSRMIGAARWYLKLTPKEKSAFIQLCLVPYCSGESFTKLIAKRRDLLTEQFNLSPSTIFNMLTLIASRSDLLLFESGDDSLNVRNSIALTPLKKHIYAERETLFTGGTDLDLDSSGKRRQPKLPRVSPEQVESVKRFLSKEHSEKMLQYGISPFRAAIYNQILSGENPFHGLKGAKNGKGAYERCYRLLTNSGNLKDSDTRGILRLAASTVVESEEQFMRLKRSLTHIASSASPQRKPAKWLLALLNNDQPLYREKLFTMYGEGYPIQEIVNNLNTSDPTRDSVKLNYLSAIFSRLDFYISDLSVEQMENINLFKADQIRRFLSGEAISTAQQLIGVTSQSEGTLTNVPTTEVGNGSEVLQDTDIMEASNSTPLTDAEIIGKARAMIIENGLDSKYQTPKVELDYASVLTEMIALFSQDRIAVTTNHASHRYTIFLSPLERELFERLDSDLNTGSNSSFESILTPVEFDRLKVVAALYHQLANSKFDLLKLDYPDLEILPDDNPSFTSPEISHALKHKLLTDAQFALLCREHHYDPDITYERFSDIENEITIRNMRLLTSIIRNKFSSTPFTRMELIAFGNSGLLNAIRHMNPTLGFTFSTYATNWIKQAIHRYITNARSTIRIPVHMRPKLAKLSCVVEDAKAYGVGSDRWYLYIAEEMDLILPENTSKVSGAAYIGQVKAKVDRLLHFLQTGDTISFDQLVFDGDDELGEFIADAGQNTALDASTSVDVGLLRETIESVLKDFNPIERQIVELRFGLNGNEPHTLNEVAKALPISGGKGKEHLSHERVRQIEAQILPRIKAALSRESVWPLIRQYLEH